MAITLSPETTKELISSIKRCNQAVADAQAYFTGRFAASREGAFRR